MADFPDRIDSFKGEYRFLSNFAPSPFTLRLLGRDWLMPTVEHGFQSAKVLVSGRAQDVDWLWLTIVTTNPDPVFAKQRGKKIPIDVERWNRVAPTVMRRCLDAKFTDPNLRARLLATGYAELVEGNTWGDTVWGQVNGKGKNLLGKALMAVREEIRG